MAGSSEGAPSTCTLLGPPERMIADGRLGRHLGGGDAVRHDLGVHVELAHPPGDQLGVLRAEVDHQHGPCVCVRHLSDGRRPRCGRARPRRNSPACRVTVGGPRCETASGCDVAA